ncbi:uncharacterized protein ColSpa_07809 [Colletotrichum spaethianum]|uniref:Uncharacterized protein n=1 Tax=Colletotrichum spaethianum TaxID=700344 RepID=A0AA37URA0_9PEZI|nr:uncharacterized protein ColSpa_07809 [Colletotrichum spaethianum]GKT47628.1 hypothetical protein ColSpa_07809 [Colletotrichum spaethianum]
MSLNLTSPFSPLPSYALGTGLTFIGLLGFVRPFAIYDAFGIARPLSAEPEAFSYAKSARDLATGALFILLETYQEGSGNEDAVTALFAVTACVGIADWLIVKKMGGEGGRGDRKKGLVHLGSGVVLGAFAVWRFMY